MPKPQRIRMVFEDFGEPARLPVEAAQKPLPYETSVMQDALPANIDDGTASALRADTAAEAAAAETLRLAGQTTRAVERIAAGLDGFRDEAERSVRSALGSVETLMATIIGSLAPHASPVLLQGELMPMLAALRQTLMPDLLIELRVAPKTGAELQNLLGEISNGRLRIAIVHDQAEGEVVMSWLGGKARWSPASFHAQVMSIFLQLGINSMPSESSAPVRDAAFAHKAELADVQ